MAMLCKFPCFLSFSHDRLFLSHKQQQKFCCNNYRFPSNGNFTTCACSIKKPRRGRKVKSDAELRNDLREFLSTVGLPEDHVPSLKELQDNGRNDLANIVRRRGYKLIRHLLDPTESDVGSTIMEMNLAKSQDQINDDADIATGQDGKGKDCSLSTEGPIIKSLYGNIDVDMEHIYGEQICTPKKSPVNLSLEEKALYDVEQKDKRSEITEEDGLLTTPSNTVEQDGGVKCMVEGNSSSTSLYDVEKQDLNSSNDTCMPSESSPYLEEEAKHDVGRDEKVSNGAERISLSTNLSLKEKVANFIHNGDLNAIADDVHGLSNVTAIRGSNGFKEPGNMVEDHLKVPSEGNFGKTVGKSDTPTLNGSLLTSVQVVPLVTLSQSHRNDLPDEGQASADVDQEENDEISKQDNPIEINHLKFTLHQKELELSKLKEQIEQEKLALFAMQTKAEREVKKAQKLMSEKDAELLAAEEGLSGLVEVEIQYYGDGEVVEVAGSFNGWHHQIRMDSQPSSSIKDQFGSRKFRLWSTMLWLYPGVYEIKFIVDCHWKVDPQRESVTKGGICNNILLVDR